MEPLEKLHLERAENELILGDSLFKISNDAKIKVDTLKIKQDITFYSGVISHSYYCIFYCAKAYLLSKGIKTKHPSEHMKTYNEFSKFVKTNELDKELLEIYDEEFTKAEVLLNIFSEERKKRAEFTYEKLPQANKKPAEESLKNAEKFFKAIYNLLSSPI